MTGRGVFLDRDGVINHNWFNPSTREWESPIRPDDFRFRPSVLDALAALQAHGFHLFLVSNQPSAAKGKCTLDDLREVHERFAAALDAAAIVFEEFYYAYSHPDAVIPELSGHSPGRKPSPYFLEIAIGKYRLDRSNCWMVGDRDTDIECGRRAGVRTIQVESSEPDGNAATARPDFRAPDLSTAVTIILASDSADADAERLSRRACIQRP